MGGDAAVERIDDGRGVLPLGTQERGRGGQSQDREEGRDSRLPQDRLVTSIHCHYFTDEKRGGWDSGMRGKKTVGGR